MLLIESLKRILPCVFFLKLKSTEFTLEWMNRHVSDLSIFMHWTIYTFQRFQFPITTSFSFLLNFQSIFEGASSRRISMKRHLMSISPREKDSFIKTIVFIGKRGLRNYHLNYQLFLSFIIFKWCSMMPPIEITFISTGRNFAVWHAQNQLPSLLWFIYLLDLRATTFSNPLNLLIHCKEYLQTWY